jgi:hypothetical protein
MVVLVSIEKYVQSSRSIFMSLSIDEDPDLDSTILKGILKEEGVRVLG